MPKPYIRNVIESSVPSRIVPEIRGKQQKNPENQRLLKASSILPDDQGGEFIFISGVGFPSREAALKRIEKFQKEQKNCFIGTAAYSRKEEKLTFATRLTGFSLNFNSTVLFESSQALLHFLPEGLVLPDEKGCHYISWLFDREYMLEETDALLKALKDIFAGRATVTPRVPWNGYTRKAKFPGEVTLDQFKKGVNKALDRLLEAKGLKKPSGMAPGAPESLMETRNDSGDVDVAVEGIESVEDMNMDMKICAELVEGTDEHCAEVVGLEELEMEQDSTAQEMSGTKPETESYKLLALDWARAHLPEEIEGEFYCYSTNELPPDREEKGDWGDNFVETLEKLVEVSLKATKDPNMDVYFGLNTFSKKNRKAHCAVRTKVVANDFDIVKEDDTEQKAAGKSPNYDKALSQAVALHKMIGVKPSLVKSGLGVHSYVVLDKTYSSSEVKTVAEKLKMLALASNFKIDPVVSADMARVLRMPGTVHRKTTQALPVVAKQLGDAIALEALAERVDELLRQEGIGQKLVASKNALAPSAEDAVMGRLMGYGPVVIAENRGAISSAVDFLIEQRVMDKGYGTWWGVVKDFRGACDVDVCTDDDEQFLRGEAQRFSEASKDWNEQEFDEKWADKGVTNGRIKNLFTLARGLGWKNPGADGVAGACGGGDDTREVIKLLAGEMHANVTNILKVLATKEIYRVGAALYATKMNDEKIIEPSKLLRKENLGTEVSRHALLMKWSQQKKKFVPTDMPDNVAKAIISEEEYPAIRAMLGVARQPFIRRDWSLVNMAGYDENSNIYCAFNPEDYNIC